MALIAGSGTIKKVSKINIDSRLELPTSTAINQLCQLALWCSSQSFTQVIFKYCSHSVETSYPQMWLKLSLNVAASQFDQAIMVNG